MSYPWKSNSRIYSHSNRFPQQSDSTCGGQRGRFAGLASRPTEIRKTELSFLVRAEHWQKDVENRMKEWGIDRNWDKGFMLYWNKLKSFVQEVAEGKVPSKEPPNSTEMLPLDPVAALRVIMEQEILCLDSEKGLLHVTDTLKDEVEDTRYFVPPFKLDHGYLTLRREYARVPSSRLNPLTRYQFSRVPAKEQLRRQYVSDEGDPQSLVFHAVVAHYACHYAKCVNCAAESVRWNEYVPGVENRYWKKLVCENCGSVYEIKAASNNQVAQRKLSKEIDGGTFLSQFVAVQQELHGTSGKHYLALLSAETVDDCWPVYVAVIDRVVPMLKDRSFEIEGDNRPRVYTKIYVKKDTIDTWFHAPVFHHDAREMAERVIDMLPKKRPQLMRYPSAIITFVAADATGCRC